MMLYLKACPRCRGDVKYESDMFGRFMECLQCGFLISSKKEAARSSGEESTVKKAANGSERAA